MKKEKRVVANNTQIEASVGYYYTLKGSPMVFISGNFFKGGFNLSKKKVATILNNRDELQRFVDGKYDEDLSKLADDEILKL